MKGKCKGCTYNCCEFESVPLTLTNTGYCLIAKNHLKTNTAPIEALKVLKQDGYFQPLPVPTWWERKIQLKYRKKFGNRTSSAVVMSFTPKGQQMINNYNKGAQQ